MKLFVGGLLVAAVLLAAATTVQAEGIRVGSKRFTESYILGEILTQSATRAGAPAVHRPGLGNTAILLEALKSGAIDVYPEYTGTIAREVLKSGQRLDIAALNARLAPRGLAVSVPIGFANSYALGMRRAEALRLGIAGIADLARHPGLKAGFSHEFLGRGDGWPGLKAAYALPQAPRGLDHGLAYEALAAGELDVIDIYTTDAKIARYDIVALADPRAFFPPYAAVLLHRSDAPAKFPLAFAAFAKLEGRLDEATMVKLNARAEIDKQSFSQVAAGFLDGGRGGPAVRSLWSAVFAPDFWRLLLEHARLVAGSLAAAVVVGVPLGVAAARLPWIAQPVLLATGLMQTIPSLALLAFLIPLTGSIGTLPALIALFLYALLPIARNTHTGLVQVSAGLHNAALALGLRSGVILARIELPLAAPTILAGVKTSAVINVGTATVAAFIGAGGFGERISQGLALNDHTMLLAGALPAAGLALLVHVAFEAAERAMVPRTR
jgi:osmoprotectant transport system permease protein